LTKTIKLTRIGCKNIVVVISDNSLSTICHLGLLFHVVKSPLSSAISGVFYLGKTPFIVPSLVQKMIIIGIQLPPFLSSLHSSLTHVLSYFTPCICVRRSKLPLTMMQIMAYSTLAPLTISSPTKLMAPSGPLEFPHYSPIFSFYSPT